MVTEKGAGDPHRAPPRGKDLLRYPSVGKSVCDIGGGSVTSPLLTAILMRYPGAQGVVFDLPETSYAHDPVPQDDWEMEDEKG
jgi:hypothetical protein